MRWERGLIVGEGMGWGEEGFGWCDEVTLGSIPSCASRCAPRVRLGGARASHPCPIARL